MSSHSELFESHALGELTLPNRFVMAPLTRNRAGEHNAPGEMNAEYYRQRASAGLIITEATQVSPQGQGYPNTPGIHSDEQVRGWQTVTDAVHDAGGRIFLQLWHVGRISHSAYHDGEKPVAPSAVKPAGKVLKPNFEEVPFETPRALDTDEVPVVVEQYRTAAEKAKAANFDGVEIHAANGYLIDQFLRSGTNHRTDRYGGSLEHRTRFLQEVIGAVMQVWSPERTGIRFSPLSDFNDMLDDDPEHTFQRAAEIACEQQLTYVHIVEPDEPKPPILDDETGAVFRAIRSSFDETLIANGNYDAERGADAIDRGYADLISFGRAFLANPDLPERIRNDYPINMPDPSTFYGGDHVGYTDYPTWEEIQDGSEDGKSLIPLSELPPRG